MANDLSIYTVLREFSIMFIKELGKHDLVQFSSIS